MTIAKELLQLKGTDVLGVPIEVNSGQEFCSLTIVTLETKAGFIDVLFNSKGELLRQNEQDGPVKKLSSFFNKSFEPITFDGIPCWGHRLIN